MQVFKGSNGIEPRDNLALNPNGLGFVFILKRASLELKKRKKENYFFFFFFFTENTDYIIKGS